MTTRERAEALVMRLALCSSLDHRQRLIEQFAQQIRAEALEEAATLAGAKFNFTDPRQRAANVAYAYAGDVIAQAIRQRVAGEEGR